MTVHGTRLDNSDGGMLLAGTRLALVLEQLINRNQGLVFGQALELRGAQLDNQRGTLGATDALRVSLAIQAAGSDGLLDNRQGRLDSAGSLTLDGVVLDNRGGALSSAGDLEVRSAAALDNAGGVIETDAALSLHSARLDNRDGG
ncbi:hypothetical protein G3435_17415, partial [Pseudomonas sp. MAFF212428]|nr:hypothetical protein [Pseudomonas brassicae]